MSNIKPCAAYCLHYSMSVCMASNMLLRVGSVATLALFCVYCRINSAAVHADHIGTAHELWMAMTSHPAAAGVS
jgi:hypothetical protein